MPARQARYDNSHLCSVSTHIVASTTKTSTRRWKGDWAGAMPMGQRGTARALTLRAVDLNTMQRKRGPRAGRPSTQAAEVFRLLAAKRSAALGKRPWRALGT